MIINDQPVENRRQLVVTNASRRSTEASPQDALRQRQSFDSAQDEGVIGKCVDE